MEEVLTPEELSLVLMSATESLTPMLEAATGIKQELLDRGWSAASAEEVGVSWMLGFLRTVWSQPQAQPPKRGRR